MLVISDPCVPREGRGGDTGSEISVDGGSNEHTLKAYLGMPGVLSHSWGNRPGEVSEELAWWPSGRARIQTQALLCVLIPPGQLCSSHGVPRGANSHSLAWVEDQKHLERSVIGLVLCPGWRQPSRGRHLTPKPREDRQKAAGRAGGRS